MRVEWVAQGVGGRGPTPCWGRPLSVLLEHSILCPCCYRDTIVEHCALAFQEEEQILISHRMERANETSTWSRSFHNCGHHAAFASCKCGCCLCCLSCAWWRPQNRVLTLGPRLLWALPGVSGMWAPESHHSAARLGRAAYPEQTNESVWTWLQFASRLRPQESSPSPLPSI